MVEGRVRHDASQLGDVVVLGLDVKAVEHEGKLKWCDGGVSLTVGGTLAASELEDWAAGRTLRAPVSLREPAFNLGPGVPDRRPALADRGTRYVGSVKSAALVEVVSPGNAVEEAAAAARRAIRRVVADAVGRWSAESAAIVVAILIGDRAGLSDEVERRLQEAGTYHVIAISGGNIAILAGLLLGVLRLACGRSSWRFVVASAVLAAYALLAGGSPSVVRATIMAITCLVAQAVDHRTPVWNAIGVASALVIAASPMSVRDPGFPLTFGATLGILVGMERWQSMLPHARWARVPATLLLASMSAEVALMPVAARAFSRATFAGLLLNFAAIPLMSVAQVAGLATLALAPFTDRLAPAAGYVAHVGASGLVASARFVDVAPWTAFRVPPPHMIVIAGYYAGWLLWLVAPGAARKGMALTVDGGSGGERSGRLVRRLRRASLGVAVLSAAWVLVSPAGRIRGAIPDGRLSVTFLDVGQADATIVRLPDARTLLFDTGGSRTGSFDVGGRVIMPALWALDVYRLDAMVVTHADPDHIGGAAALARDFRVLEVWEGVPVPPDENLAQLRREAGANGIRWRTIRRGDRLRFGEVTLDVLHPPAPDWERQKVRNDDSIVVDLRYRGVSFLMTGDIGAAVEREIAAGLVPARVRVLKVPHHGSASSSSPGFLAAASPSVAVFTTGRSRPPAAFDRVLRRYQDAGIAIYRTDRDGAVTIAADGNTLEITTFTGHAKLEGEQTGTQSSLLSPSFACSHSASSASSAMSCSLPPRDTILRSISVKRRRNFALAWRSAASGSTPSFRDRLAIAKSRSPISSSTARRFPLPAATASTSVRSSSTSSWIFARTSVARSQSKPTAAARVLISCAARSAGRLAGTPPRIVFSPASPARSRALAASQRPRTSSADPAFELVPKTCGWRRISLSVIDRRESEIVKSPASAASCARSTPSNTRSPISSPSDSTSSRSIASRTS